MEVLRDSASYCEESEKVMYDITFRIDVEGLVDDLKTGYKTKDDVEYEMGVQLVKAFNKHLQRHY